MDECKPHTRPHFQLTYNIFSGLHWLVSGLQVHKTAQVDLESGRV